MQIDADVRLAAAAGGAARYLADAAGLNNEAVVQLQTAIVLACQQAFEHISRDHSHLDVTFTCLADRIEVALSHQGDASPAVGLDAAVAGFICGPSAAKPGTGAFDRVQYETRAGVAVTRLTKYIGQPAPSL
jgi:hypothetical protein